jgi:hypothetical protein
VPHAISNPLLARDPIAGFTRPGNVVGTAALARSVPAAAAREITANLRSLVAVRVLDRFELDLGMPTAHLAPFSR